MASRIFFRDFSKANYHPAAGCTHVLHSTGQLYPHKRKHERRDNELAYRKYRLAQTLHSKAANNTSNGGDSSNGLLATGLHFDALINEVRCWQACLHLSSTHYSHFFVGRKCRSWRWISDWFDCCPATTLTDCNHSARGDCWRHWRGSLRQILSQVCFHLLCWPYWVQITTLILINYTTWLRQFSSKQKMWFGGPGLLDDNRWNELKRLRRGEAVPVITAGQWPITFALVLHLNMLIHLDFYNC